MDAMGILRARVRGDAGDPEWAIRASYRGYVMSHDPSMETDPRHPDPMPATTKISIDRGRRATTRAGVSMAFRGV